MLHLRILTTDTAVFDGMADEVTLPTELGMIGVLPHHSPLVSIVTSGRLSVKKEGKTQSYTISGGILEVRPGSQVVILATAVEVVSDTDETPLK